MDCGSSTGTAFVSAFNGNADNSQVEEKLRRATDKVMNSQTEVDISTVLIEGDTATIMGIKYKRVEEPKPTTLYDIIIEWNDNEDNLTCEELVNRIKKWLPDYLVLGDDEYNAGWNDCLQHLKENLK